MLFHAFPGSVLKSGFVGVDVFFVISGFLISTIIFKGMDERMNTGVGGKPFSFVDFYSRRVRRIFPSLIFCLVTFLILGWFVLLPDEYALFGKHTAGASAYVSNLVLWSEAGDYFQVASQTKPLLHLWSLGIEEQFYLLWPAVLFIAYKLNFNIFTLALAGALASFGFELHAVKADPTASFYSPFLRFWELMAGSLLAWLKLYKTERFKALANRVGPYLSKFLQRDSKNTDYVRLCCNLLSVLGLISILIGVFALNSRHFPGSKALYPVLGAAMMIAAGKDAFLNRYLLSNKVMVWFGLISYPLYIWHWPFLSFAWIISGELPQLKVRIACVALAVAMSAITYYLVEPHLRWGRHGGIKAIGLLVAMITVGVLGYEVYHHNGYPKRMNDPEQALLDSINKQLTEGNERCLTVIPDWNRLSDGNVCRLQRSPEKNTIAVIGDSHAGHLYPGLITQTKEDEGFAVFPASCAVPLIGLHSAAAPNVVKTLPQRAYTEHLLSEAFNYILSHSNFKKVVLSHNPGCSIGMVTDTLNPGNHDINSILHDGFVRTYDALTKAGKEIYVVLDNPTYGQTFEKCKAAAVKRPAAIPAFLSSSKTQVCNVAASSREDRQVVDNWKRLAQEAAIGHTNIHFIDLEEPMCPNGTCSMLGPNGDLLYRDGSHFNVKGSLYVAPFILSRLRQ